MNWNACHSWKYLFIVCACLELNAIQVEAQLQYEQATNVQITIHLVTVASLRNKS